MLYVYNINIETTKGNTLSQADYSQISGKDENSRRSVYVLYKFMPFAVHFKFIYNHIKYLYHKEKDI